MGNPIFIRNCSTSRLNAAPPTITSYIFPPKASMSCWRTLLKILSCTTGSASKSFILGVESLGNTFFLIIFSIIKGTDTTMRGLISPNALKIILGEGMRVRKKMWQPLMNSKRNSKAIPYICAMGSIEMILSPRLRMCPNFSWPNCTFDQSAR